MIEIKGNFKFEITDDLRMNVWHLNDDVTVVPPFWYQNGHPSGRFWNSKEEILEYLDIELPILEQRLADSIALASNITDIAAEETVIQ